MEPTTEQQQDTCAVCGKHIKPGDGVAIDRGRLMHIGCYEKATRQP